MYQIKFRTHFAVFSLLIYSLFTACTSSQDQREENNTQALGKPNMIFVLVDDLGYGDLGCYGQETIPTPNLDRMAAEGIRFTQHYSGNTVCAPSRCALMTGKHNGHAWVRGNYEIGPRGFGAELELRPEDVTIPEVLKQAGYTTAMIGKWGLGMDQTTGEPNKKGFDYSYGYLNQAYAHYQFPDSLYRDGIREAVPENAGGKRGAYSGDILTNETLRFIRDQKDTTFFIYLSYTTPHAEMLVPEDSLFEKFKGQFEEIPFKKKSQGGDASGLGAYDSQDYPFAAYATMVYRLDKDVQKILDQLKDLGIDDNTLVLFSSDNGSHKEGGADPAFFASSGPLRGHKRDLYEGGIRVPLIAHWPKGILSGQLSDHPSAFWDVLPTLADIAAVDINSLETDGISFLPTLQGRKQEQKEHNYLYWEFHEDKYSHQAIRKGNWKAVRLDPDSKPELYDLNNDVGEQHNVADQHPEIVEEMETIFANARTEHHLWPLKRSGK